MSAAPEFSLPALPELRTQRVLGCNWRYYDIGKGPPLVLVHGVGGDADQWAFCLDALSASHRVIAVDLPGFGRSDKPLIEYRIAGYVEWLARFLSQLGIARTSLLGHSLGGWIVATFALRFPDRVERLILNDAAGIDAGSVPIPVDLNVSTRANMRLAFEAMVYDRATISDALVDLAYSLHLERGDGYTIKSVLETLTAPQEKLDAAIASIATPTLIVWGTDDVITPPAMAKAWHRGIARSQLVTIAQCGHLPPIEKPRELVAAVQAFLRAS